MSEGFYAINKIYAINPTSMGYGLWVYPDEFPTLSSVVGAASKLISDEKEARESIKVWSKKDVLKWYLKKQEYIDLIINERKNNHPRANTLLVITKSYEYIKSVDIDEIAEFNNGWGVVETSSWEVIKTTSTIARKIEKMWESF